MSETRQADIGAGESVEALREDIAQTRQDLGETVEALAVKADVKARAKYAARQTAAKARERGQSAAVVVRERGRHVATVARERGRKTAVVAKERGRDATEKVSASVRRRPGAWASAGAGALAVGAGVVGVLAWRRRQRKPQRRAVRAWRAVADRFGR
jgi:outer membrane murein-binding lipoprotein Lpp